MKILQFGFGNPGRHVYLPHTLRSGLRGLHRHSRQRHHGGLVEFRCYAEEEKELASAYLGIGEDGVNWAFIRAALTSVANLCIIPVQDVLGLDSKAR